MPRTEVEELLKDFINKKQRRFYLHIAGLGMFFVSRSSSGIVLGYVDNRLKGGLDDHVTFILGRKYDLKGFHRKVIDKDTEVRIDPNVDYILSPDGLKKLIEDLNRVRAKFLLKIVLILIYQAVRWAFKTGYRDASLLSNEKARRINLKNPCILTDLPMTYKIPLIAMMNVFKIIYQFQKKKFPTTPTAVFRPQNVPGSVVEKRLRKGT